MKLFTIVLALIVGLVGLANAKYCVITRCAAETMDTKEEVELHNSKIKLPEDREYFEFSLEV